ncbi:hypothetical protein HID58_095349 [Brassica napus]|uniref:1,3-beta-glucan synthase subunit FKS1-like domain-containing protein n=1 Tax=Brassica napus TaxID=3708 RepID=A0ABQ7X6B8_BRANA|nr:hypothetical protein HID58_095349 [Brassica napus]
MKLKDLAFFKKKNVYGKSSKAPAKNEKRDNVRNQREHLVCLLADNHIRLTPRPEFLNKLDDRAVDAVKTKFFKNYKNWCKFLGPSKNATGKAAHSDWSNYDDLIFITAAFLRFLQSILDIILNFPGFHRWKFTEILRNILKIAVSLAWCVVLPLCDAQSNSSAPGMLKQWISFLPRDVKGVPPLHILAVALCLLPNVLTAIMFIFPMLRRWIENSDWHIIRLHVWWSQAKLANKSTVVHQSQHRERQRIGGNDGCSGLGGISNYSPNWWRNWSSTALARRKGTCDDVQLGSWKREGIQSRRMKSYLLLKRKPLLVARFVEAANAFLRRSKAKRSVMSSDTVFSFFYREVVDAQKEVSRQGKD